MRKIIILFIVLSILSISVSADFAGEFPSLSEFYGKYYLGTDRAGYANDYRLYVSENPIYGNETANKIQSQSMILVFKIVNGQWVYMDQSLNWSVTTNNINYANHDIRDYVTNNVFFSRTVRTFQQEVQAMNLIRILTHPLTGLIVSLIGLWIVSTGFSKAWQYLSMQLRKG